MVKAISLRYKIFIGKVFDQGDVNFAPLRNIMSLSYELARNAEL